MEFNIPLKFPMPSNYYRINKNIILKQDPYQDGSGIISLASLWPLFSSDHQQKNVPVVKES
jgi:hypothetical protein